MILLSLDQSTKVTGFAVFADRNLIAYGKHISTGEDLGERLHQLRNQINYLIDLHKPDYVVFEDIQLQDSVNGVSGDGAANIKVFKALAEAFGIVYELCVSKKIPRHKAILASSWKSTLKIAGKKRDEQKRNAKEFVKKTFNIECSQDEADAICIGCHALVEEKVLKRPKEKTSTLEEGFDWS